MANDSARATSPAPLANPRYALAGGFDTPTLAATAYYEKDGQLGETDFRKRWDMDIDASPFQHDFTAQGPLARERNGHSRVTSGYHDAQSQQKGWGRFVVGLATTVAGKMWSFCRESAFRGFYAGEGKGYDFSQPTQLTVDHSMDGYFRSRSPLPGQFPKERDFSSDYDQDSTPVRPSKRLHTEAGSEWIVVENNLDTREASPRMSVRKVSNPLLIGGKPPSASKASSRRSLIPVSRRTPSQISYAGSPSYAQTSFGNLLLNPAQPQHKERRASIAPTRPSIMHSRNSSHSSRPSTANGLPLSPDAQKFLAKKDRHEKETEKSMRKMSKQVQDLIKQGQAALGTKFEISDEDIDEGFEDGDAEAWEDAGADGVLANW